MRLVLGQIDLQWEEPAANVSRVAEAVRGLAVPPGSLVVLPEMFTSGFSMDPERACAGDGESMRGVAAMVRGLGAWVLAGMAVREPAGPVNAAIGFNPEGVEAFRYRKRHAFSPTGEPERYRAGELGVVHGVGPFRLAPFICYDLRFPEIYRSATKAGADLLVTIANWPTRRVDHWVTLLRSRAIENQAWVVGVNRVGKDPHVEYPGRSLVVDPRGEVVLDAGPAEGWHSVDLDPLAVEAWRREFPAWRDRRFA